MSCEKDSGIDDVEVLVVIHKPPTSCGSRYSMLQLSLKCNCTVGFVKDKICEQIPELLRDQLVFCINGEERDDDASAIDEQSQCTSSSDQKLCLHFRYDDPSLEEIVENMRKKGSLLIPLEQVTVREKK